MTASLPELLRDIYKNIISEPNFQKGLLVAVIVGILTKAGEWLRDVTAQAWHSRKSFDIAGVWIGDCWLPSYEARQLEIWHYTRKDDDVKLRFFAYDPSTKGPTKWRGGGVYRGSKLSCYYYRLAPESYESGVLALELKALGLKGAYAQFDTNKENAAGQEPLYVSNSEYRQRRIQLPLYKRLRMRFGIPPFQTYGEIEKLFAANAYPFAPRPEKQGATPTP